MRCTLHLINLITLYVLYILLHPTSYYCHINTNTLSMYIVRMLVVRYNTQHITRYAYHVCQTCRGGQTSVACIYKKTKNITPCKSFNHPKIASTIMKKPQTPHLKILNFSKNPNSIGKVFNSFEVTRPIKPSPMRKSQFLKI